MDGWEVERVAFDPAGLAPAPTADQRFAPRGAQPARGSADGEIQDYSPLSTLLPTYWEPILREPVETRTVQGDDVFIPGRELLGYAVGAQTGGVDLVGRHAYGALARIFTTGGKAEGGLSYMYSGLGESCPRFACVSALGRRWTPAGSSKSGCSIGHSLCAQA